MDNSVSSGTFRVFASAKKITDGQGRPSVILFLSDKRLFM